MVENPQFSDLSLDYYTKTYYLRDAQGNIMATYNRTYAGESTQDLSMSFSVVERSIYGSSRVANFVDSVQLAYLEAGDTEFSYPADNEILSHTNGYKHFELTNHLGNVMAVVSDIRTPITEGSGTLTRYTPELLIAKDYYPFGMEMSGRYTGVGNEDPDNKYRFGFNGQEKDDEVTGQTGSVYTAMFWEYDARIGRRWNIDPVDKPWLSSYHAFSNNPVARIDPLGDDDYFSSNGKFLYRDNSRTDYIRIIPQEKVDELVNKYQENLLYLGKNVVHIPISVQSEFSQNSVLMSEYRWGMNIEDGKVAVAKIGKFYARSTNGYDGTENIIGQQASESLMSSGIDPYNNKIRHIGITIELPPATVSGHTHSELDNAGNLKSVLIHEKYHYENHLVKNKYNGSYAYSPKPEWEIELEAYFAQVSDETWGGTTELFRKGELDKIQGYYDKITSTEDRKKWRDDFAGKGIELK